MDVHSQKIRSFNMSRIKGKDTGPEILVRRFLFSKGFRYRLHRKDLPGKPDLTFPKLRKVLFVHGCYWHGHKGCKYFVAPKTRTEWWLNKIRGNAERDKRNIALLKKQGWSPIVIWECELKTEKKEKTFRALIRELSDANI